MTTRTTRLARVAGPAAVLAGTTALALGAIPSAAGAATHARHRDPTAYYGYTGGVQTFTVPAGVYSVTINAVGAAGGSTTGGVNTGGAGASVFSTVSVTPGQTLYVYVGGTGSVGSGGFNGGGGSTTGGGGGGASDVRTVLGDLGSRVVVAAGGGGAGSDGTCAASGGNGGAQATNGEDGTTCGGTATAGTGGVAGPTATAGTNGTPGTTTAATSGSTGQGGTGGIQSDYATADGGGGGGGVTGGGGGGAGGYDTTNAAGGSGGGGGSSMGTSLGSSTAAASVTISYGTTPPPPPPPSYKADLAISLIHLGTFRYHTSRQYEMRVINTSNYNTSRTVYVTLTVPSGMKVTFGGKGTYWQCHKDTYFSVCNRRAVIYAHASTTIKARVWIWAPAGSYRTAKATVSPTDRTPGDNTDWNTAKIYKH